MTAGEVRIMLDSHRRRRPFRVAAYALLATGAGVLLADPLRTMEDVGIAIRWVWSSTLLAGTALAIYGGIRDRYLSEFIGLPLLMTAMSAFVAVLIGSWNTASIAVACFLGSIVVIMWSRWMDLWRLVGASTRAERKRQ